MTQAEAIDWTLRELRDVHKQVTNIAARIAMSKHPVTHDYVAGEVEPLVVQLVVEGGAVASLIEVLETARATQEVEAA